MKKNILWIVLILLFAILIGVAAATGGYNLIWRSITSASTGLTPFLSLAG